MVKGKMCFLFSKGTYHNRTYGIHWDYCIGLCNNNSGIGLHWIRDHWEFYQRAKPRSSHSPKVLGKHFEIGKKFSGAGKHL